MILENVESLQITYYHINIRIKFGRYMTIAEIYILIIIIFMNITLLVHMSVM